MARTYKRLMRLPDNYTGTVHQSGYRYTDCVPCDDCGYEIMPGDYYYRETVKTDCMMFTMTDKYNVCVGCHVVEKEVAAIEGY